MPGRIGDGRGASRLGPADVRAVRALHELLAVVGLGESAVTPASSASSIARADFEYVWRRNAGELDPGVLEHLLEPLDRPGPLVDLRLAKPGQIAQLADLPRRHEAGADQPVLHQLADPFRVLDVPFAAGDVAQVLRVEQSALESILERLEHGLPVRAGRFHSDQRHCEPRQPLAEVG
jgi:hypothetical protein